MIDNLSRQQIPIENDPNEVFNYPSREETIALVQAIATLVVPTFNTWNPETFMPQHGIQVFFDPGKRAFIAYDGKDSYLINLSELSHSSVRVFRRTYVMRDLKKRSDLLLDEAVDEIPSVVGGYNGPASYIDYQYMSYVTSFAWSAYITSRLMIPLHRLMQIVKRKPGVVWDKSNATTIKSDVIEELKRIILNPEG